MVRELLSGAWTVTWMRRRTPSPLRTFGVELATGFGACAAASSDGVATVEAATGSRAVGSAGGVGVLATGAVAGLALSDSTGLRRAVVPNFVPNLVPTWVLAWVATLVATWQPGS